MYGVECNYVRFRQFGARLMWGSAQEARKQVLSSLYPRNFEWATLFGTIRDVNKVLTEAFKLTNNTIMGELDKDIWLLQLEILASKVTILGVS